MVGFDVEYTTSEGRTSRYEREVVDHGSAIGILLLDPVRQSVVMVRQYRWGAHYAGIDGFVLEVVAGLTDGQDPQDAARREAMEESGFEPYEIVPVTKVLVSPGAMSELVHLFVGKIDMSKPHGAGGGLDAEDEDIEVVEMSLDEALAMAANGEIIDAKTLIILQWVALNRETLSA